MSALKFADSYNMVVFLAKPTKSKGFEQIVDFLNANPIKYALTINPTIYTSCIEQFWATTKVKTVNGEVQLQALVDGKKMIITETSVRRDLQLEDAERIECLPNADIFKQLALMGAKSTAWNEFSSTVASAIICLATNQKFNFSKYIFESMVKNVDSSVKFLMYPRKGFSGAVTPLFPTMMVQAQKEIGEGSAMPTNPHHTPIIQPSTSQHQKKQSRRKQRKGTEIPQSSVPTEPAADEAINEENVPTHSNDPLLSGEDRLKLKDLMTLCTNLQNMVLDLEHTKTTQALEIDNLKRRVKKLEKKQWSRNYGLRRLYKVGLSARVISSEDEGLGEEDASKQRRKIHDIDADEDITLKNVHDEDMFGVNDLEGDEVVVESEVAAKMKDDEVNVVEVISSIEDSLGDQEDASKQGRKITDIDQDAEVKLVDETQGSSATNVEVSTASPTAATITNVELTMAQTLAELKSARPKTKGVVMQEPSETTTTTIPSKEKGKAQFDEEERIAREKEEANAALIAQWNDIQDKVETNYELAQRLQAEEQEELTIEEKSKLFQQLLKKRRKHFAAKRA
ncbi:hypothetical protein Tco_0017924 [Tanacetum coccineum]